MIAVVCVDDRGGMLFNRRRQSQDRVLRGDLLALAAGAVGLALVFRPWDSARLLTILLGAALLAEGILNLCVAVSTVKIVSYQQPDVIEVTSFEVENETL